ncbi:hypothetical protein Patl1_29265 [Pistacia atlantica]|uniref:Uncharacterized protein n=2 Tax=Pistacia TaxID=55512 RepID=A0ACC1BBP2_9ROSI|nr:hypothetical protein Patl1_29265 [Pistacia atlantica]
MDGNRRYAKKCNLEEGAGHRAGYSSLMSLLKYCYELGVKYVTIYAFSIENFKRKPDEVHDLMDLMLEKMQAMLKEESIVNRYGIRVHFIGKLKLLSEPVRVAAEKVMRATEKNSKVVLLVCVAYTSGDEIVHAVQESCKHKRDEIEALNERKTSNVIPNVVESYKDRLDGSQTPKATGACNGVIEGIDGTNKINVAIDCTGEKLCDDQDEAQASKVRIGNGLVDEIEEREKMQGQHCVINLVDIEKHMYMAVAPDPDILLRSSGEARLSNFLLWQTSNCLLYSPAALWPEIGLSHLVWAVLNFQRNHAYLEKKKKQS